MRSLSLRDVRTRLLVIVVAALTLGLAAATVGFNLLLASTSARGADQVLRQRAYSERSLIQIRQGHLHVTEHVDDRQADSRVWVFEGGRLIESPHTEGATTQAARELTQGPSRHATIASSDERLLSVPILVDGHRDGTVVTGISLAPYEHTVHVALIASIVFAATLLLGVGLAVWWLLRSALHPVAQMTEQAAAWSEGDLERRFRLGLPHDELTRLAWTLDELLDRLSASLRHERLFSAELSHELRTPLAKLRAEAELALRRPRPTSAYVETLNAVIANADRIERIVSALFAAARYSGGQRGVADAGAVARTAVAACRQSGAFDKIMVEVVGPEGERIGVDPAFAERILQPVIDNAFRYARSAVRITITRAGGTVEFAVGDDGPGIGPTESESIFEPASRGSAGKASAAPGAGLGLSLARRLARTASGDVVAGDGDGAGAGAGASFLVQLPAA